MKKYAAYWGIEGIEFSRRPDPFTCYANNAEEALELIKVHAREQLNPRNTLEVFVHKPIEIKDGGSN